jgi:superfamily II RNA helicase
MWSTGAPFKDLLPQTSLAEGDIIRLFRRIIDMIGQIHHASTDYELKDRLDACERLIDRDLVAINF